MVNKGYTQTLEHVQKRRLTVLGAKHGLWKGNDVGYNALHAWVKRHKPKPKFCERCGKQKRLDLTNISGKYLRDLPDFQYLCRRCHMELDGRLDIVSERASKVIVRKRLERQWTTEELNYLINHFRYEQQENILSNLPRKSWSAIKNMAYKLRLIRIYHRTHD